MDEGGVCDICNDELPRSRIKDVGPKSMRAAIEQGFDPFHLGIAPSSNADRHYPAQQSPDFKIWAHTLGMADADWGLCPQCWAKLQPYLVRRNEGSTFSHRRAPSPAAESFRCSKCGHEFADDNPDYPKVGKPIRLDNNIKCVKCKTTIVEAGRVSRGVLALIGGAVAGLVVGRFFFVLILGVDTTAATILCIVVGIIAGIAFEIYARADIRRRLAFLASEPARRSD